MSKKGKRRHYSKHHRKCRSNGGDDSSRNISVVDQDRHNLWHAMFRNMKPEEIFREINDVWLPPDYEIILRRNNENRKSNTTSCVSELLSSSPI